MIKQHEAEFSISMMCRLLLVSRSHYYSWKTQKPCARKQADEKLVDKIKQAFEDERKRAGSPRITLALREGGTFVGRHRVARLMRENGLRAKAAKKYKATTNSVHKLPVAPNLLKQNFEAKKPDKKYVSDITYIWTDEGWLYLAVVMDLYSRMIVGWSMSERMSSTLVCDALTMAMFKRKQPTQVIVHSDRGSQYCSREYQNLLRKHKLKCSMSKRGDCYDNAAMESWNHSFKVEAIHGERFATREIAKEVIFDYIEVYYNRKRRHSKLGYLSPEAFEAKKVA
jgi:transposase InsO family protein